MTRPHPEAPTGILAAPFLPLKPDFSIDYAVLETHLREVASHRPIGIAMNMDASEGPSLSREEQLEVVRVSKAAIDGVCPLYSGLIAGWTGEAVTVASQLKDAGADGLIVFPVFPTFLGDPMTADTVAGYFRAIGDAVDLPMIGFRMRPVPDWTSDILEALSEIPQFIGFKDATHLMPPMRRLFEDVRKLPRRVSVFTANDAFILEVILMGADGALIGFAGTATDQLIAMHRAVAERDLETAEAIWSRIGPLARFCWRPPMRNYRPRMKELLVLEGKFRHATVRPPQPEIDDAERAELRRLAVHAGLIANERATG